MSVTIPRASRGHSSMADHRPAMQPSIDKSNLTISQSVQYGTLLRDRISVFMAAVSKGCSVAEHRIQGVVFRRTAIRRSRGRLRDTRTSARADSAFQPPELPAVDAELLAEALLQTRQVNLQVRAGFPVSFREWDFNDRPFFEKQERRRDIGADAQGMIPNVEDRSRLRGQGPVGCR